MRPPAARSARWRTTCSPTSPPPIAPACAGRWRGWPTSEADGAQRASGVVELSGPAHVNSTETGGWLSVAMFDHVTIRVADRTASEAFYATLLTQLGIDITCSAGPFAEWRDFSLAQADGDHPPTQRLHVAFVAPTNEQVDAFWQAGVDAGYRDDGAPGPRPQYLEGLLRRVPARS